MKESLLTTGRGLYKRCVQTRLVGDILAEILSSNSPLAKGYRKHLASKEKAEKGGKNDE